MGIDWFRYADWPLEEVRKDFGVPPKSAKSVAAGSVTPWEPGGISPFQHQYGQTAAAEHGWEYDSYGATPS